MLVQKELTFDGLTSLERHWVHKAAGDIGFASSSRGAPRSKSQRPWH